MRLSGAAKVAWTESRGGSADPARFVTKEEAARLAAVQNTSLEFIGLMTPEGTLIDSNRASLNFTGAERDDVIGKPLADTPCFRANPPARDLLQQALATARAGNRVRSELSLSGCGGETTYFDFCLAPLHDSAGAIAFLVAEARNLTDLKRMQKALFMSEKLAAVGRLASSIAHEINNPLESVMNLIYLARNAAPDDAQRYLDMADQEIRRVSIIANQTLRFHKQASRPQPVTAADLFATVLGIYEARIRNAHVQVEKKFRTDRAVSCFPGDVRQVLNNLVANAIEAMPFGGRLLLRCRAGLDWKTARPGLVLTIADNGAGISPAVERHIFEAFFTTKGTAGNGLGLWVCREIAHRHNGRLRVRSTQRQGRNGTAFTLFLPFDASHAQPGVASA